MHAQSTLFLDVGLQRDFWPSGAWPLLGITESKQAEALCALGRRLEIRAGGVCCQHGSAAQDLPVHCRTGTPGVTRVPACAPRLPVRVYAPDVPEEPVGRDHAVYLGSGCQLPIADAPRLAAVFAHLIAGVRDAVVFGAGVEFGVAHAIEGLLSARIRTHLALDATGAADAAVAQTLIEGWKRRGLDVLTVATVERLLHLSARP